MDRISEKRSVLDRNLLLDAILSISKGKRILALIGVFVLGVFCFVFVCSEDAFVSQIFVLVFLAVECLLWHIIISFFPTCFKHRIANIFLLIFLLAGVVSVVLNPVNIDEPKVLLCTEISPDGSNVAEGYKISENDDGTFFGRVYVKNTAPNEKHQIVSQEVFRAENICDLNVSWANNTTLVVNGESIKLNWLEE